MRPNTISASLTRPGLFSRLAMACSAVCNALVALVRPPALVRGLNEADRIRGISALNEAFGQDAEWFRLAPFGDYPVTIADPKTGRKRKVTQRIDAQSADEIVRSFNSVIERIARGFRGLPIYQGHVDDPEWLAAHPGAKVEAVGRIKKVEKRDDGIWAARALNDEGKRLLTGDAAPYDGHSPHWGMIEISPGICRPVELYSTALTNRPNIPSNVMGRNEADPEFSPAMKAQLIALLAALGRPQPTAVTDEQLVSAANEALPVATQLVTASNELTTVRASLATANTNLTAATNEAATLRTQIQTERTARAELVLIGAINEGRITVAQKPEWLGKLTATGSDFATVAGEIVKLKAVNTRSQVDAVGGRKAEAVVDKSKITAINEAVAAKKAANPNYTHHEAYMAVRGEKPDLFISTGS